MTQEQMAKVVSSENQECPFCGSENIDWDNKEQDGSVVKELTECTDCGKEWYAYYQLTGACEIGKVKQV